MAKNITDIEEVKASEIKPLDKEQFRRDIDSLVAGRENVASENQELGERFKKLEKERGYNMKGVKFVLSLMKMSDENRNAFLTSVSDYVQALDMAPPETLFDKTGADVQAKAEAQKKTSKRLTSILAGAH